MADDTGLTTGIAHHGAARLPSVDIDSFNIELKDDEGFLGDRASKGAFRKIFDRWRKPLRKSGEDPFGDEPSDKISKKKLDEMLVGDDTEASAVVHSAIEEFAQELAYVTRRFLNTKAWAKTERIVVGGGFRDSRLGELAIARTDIILKSEDFKVDLVPIRFHPDDAGLIGTLHLAPSWIFEAHDGVLAVDIGGTNIRCGVVETRWKKAPDLSKATVWKSELWRHADDEPTREGAVKRLVKMLKDLIAAAEKENLRLAPFIGIACPGVIKEDGGIEKGAQNLPGNWESSKFNLPASLVEAIPQIGDHDTAIVMHNDGVAQGLAEVPFMQDVTRWGVLTIGTGLGNARYTNRRKDNGKDDKKADKAKNDDGDNGEKKTKKAKKADA
ncbi:ROK family protein [Bradyrhizobium viridifuturi]|jgi:predicted NBD/HSP70 family sugar kinase|uniref:ROK family protein n=1 Tax=Bradyrhizobium TaxID=374 RepID=UPI00039667FA|nr:ROK family protein [Bradyrhizobium viridifuturi]ERF80400.1 MAG: two-component system, sensor histidine kinase RegB [Bradyrhizobium sp. DFCI-1]OYU59889.1 MAG: ROK family protein [Bradyrhizobium sp. PARBB1]PSO16670.1 ROK family protein [Bradyrhizobium sp. MOS004]QRI69447.1 ROK family protein [Bradyrhizobium sp. PSBB068]HAQ83228.1 ROK family protein [Bradyrhizobium sp.]